MGVNRPIDITAEERKTVLALLVRYLPNTTVWVYGSRVKWTSRPESDLDLVVFATSEQAGRVADLREAFEESNLPFRVDLFVWDEVPEQFRKQIEAEHVVLVEKEEQQTARDWHETTLAGLLSFANGKSSPGRSDGLPYPVYGSNGIIGFSDETNADPNTIVIGRVGTYCGSLHYSNRICWVTDNAIRSTAINGNDTKFLFYLLQTLRLNEWRTGSGQPLLNQKTLSSIPVAVPDPTEQRTIAHVLGTLDDKIELNRRMNQTLEEMARTLFKSWFVDFDPVRAKATLKQRDAPPSQGGNDWNVERTRAYLDRMDPDIAALFPDSFVDSELGPIPEGWEVKALGECVEVERGLSYKGAALSLSGVPMHNLNSIYEGGGYKNDGIKYYSGDYQARHVVEPGDVIVANTEQGHDRLLIGFSAIVPKYFGENGLFSHHIYRVRPKGSVTCAPDFVCRLLNTQAIHDTVSGYATGTTVNMLPVDSLKIPRFVAPPRQVVTKFSTIAKVPRTRQEKLIAESRTLAGLRDALLPKLIYGKTRVKDEFKR